MSFSKNLKFTWPWFLLTAFLVVLTVLRISLFDVGFLTAWDESYYLIKCEEAYIGEYVTGKSLWNYLAIKWFPSLDLTSKIDSCWANWILEFSAAIIGSLSCIKLFGRNDFFKYFSLNYLLCFLWGTSYAGVVLNYVPMQAFLTIIATYTCALFLHEKKLALKVVCLLFWGGALGVSIFVILPSTILLWLCSFLVLFFTSPMKKYVINYTLLLLLGGWIGILYVHLFVCDLDRVIEAMTFTAHYITKVGYGYSPLSIVLQVGLFIRDYLFIILFYIGAFFLATRIEILNTFVGGLCYILMILILNHYQIKPTITPAMILSSVVFLPFLFSSKKKDWKQVVTFLFMFSFPIIASIGTNTYLGSRMICFTAPWILYMSNNNVPKYTLLASVIVLLLSPSLSYTKKTINRDDTYHFTKGRASFAKLSLTNEQVQYYDNVYDIMSQYGFKAHQSVVFTTEYDYATVYAFEAELSSNFYQKNNFLHVDRSVMRQPDFIFLSKWDKDVLGKELAEMPWGYPEKYDEYYVGTPESPDFPWDSNRWLYCRKPEKIDEIQ